PPSPHSPPATATSTPSSPKATPSSPSPPASTSPRRRSACTSPTSSPNSASPPAPRRRPPPAVTASSRDEVPHHLDQLGRVERLRQVRVHPDLPAPALVVVLRPRRDQHHLDVPRRLVLAQPLRRRPPVQRRHHDVQRHHARPYLKHLIQAILPIGGRHHLEPLKVQIDGDELTNDLVIVHDQNFAKKLTHAVKLAVAGRSRGVFPGCVGGR